MSAVSDTDWGAAFSVCCGKYPHCGRQSEFYKTGKLICLFADAFGRSVGNYFAVVHNNDPVGAGENLLKAMLGDYNRHAEILVDFVDGCKKTLGGDRIKLRGRLVENENVGTHCHYGSKIKYLLLTA